MKDYFYFEGDTLHVEYSLTIPADQKVVWQYLTETEKISEWFAEIEVGELKRNGHMVFRLPDSEITMPILSFVQDKEISYEWGGVGSVCFDLTSTTEGTKLYFYETLPADFSYRIRDITGWSMALKRLKQVVLGEQTTFDMDEFQEIKKRYRQRIADLKPRND
ncbi:hypothetical protein GCM10025886_16270 [Tetragenococcus halophilus subsp. flandriensis]|uniref:SRPBCC domain-containing protein n=1 Tax=Tetragenococcus halophilus TaxID=51669 RepID=UPI001F24B5FB|nr:SRPBCC domain-containing protein [Tetragenococcus halophilus]MCF1685593.1 SRPBCC domain-containing protein [Tetragenococcus halophilus]GMA08476.1 hypothetical protein GCM10025886_16270 [Tetragenococcus halophilus subsp. flandriensis]